MDQIKFISEIFYKNYLNKNISKKLFGDLLNSSQNIKVKLANNIMNKKILNLINKIKKNKIYGLKILGAGGGGFVLCFMKNNKIIKNFEYEDFKVDNSGTKIIFSE